MNKISINYNKIWNIDIIKLSNSELLIYRKL